MRDDDDEKIAARQASLTGPGRSVPASDRNVGQVLRSIYTATVAEDVPPDLLDLLGKLE